MNGKLASITREHYIQMYHIEELSTIEIAKRLGCAKSSVLRNMKRLHVPRRTVGEALAERTMPKEIRKKISKTKKIIQQGENHSSWKGGRILTSTGYYIIWIKDHPFANPKGYVPEHRLVVESVVGRYLKPEEVVHHIDKTRSNNSPDNLMLCKSNSEHLLVHSGKVKVVPVTELISNNPEVVSMADHRIEFTGNGIEVN